MNESVRLGRIAGVDVGVNWTVFVIFLLITFGLAAGRFPQQHPGLEGLGAPGITVGVFAWLAVINVVLAVFNLVPAAPLDGGRILRGLLWKRRGDRLGASLTAARAGRAFGWLLVVLGLIDFVGGAGGGGLWLVLIGWFLTNAAGAEEHHAQVRHALGDVRIDQVMTSDPVVVPSDLPVSRRRPTRRVAGRPAPPPGWRLRRASPGARRRAPARHRLAHRRGPPARGG